MLELKVKLVGTDQQRNFSIVLSDAEEKTVLPIVIGPFEAQSIALALQGQVPPRPLTHDLLKTVCESLGGRLEKVVITDIREDTFYAELHLRRNGEGLVLDSRPSDAIALALRFEAPIFMEPRLVEFTYDYDDMVFRDEEDEELEDEEEEEDRDQEDPGDSGF